jgi:hypothetical protein
MMHYIAVDLETEAWVKAGLTRLEHYLDCWRTFTELYPADPQWPARQASCLVKRVSGAQLLAAKEGRTRRLRAPSASS